MVYPHFCKSLQIILYSQFLYLLLYAAFPKRWYHSIFTLIIFRCLFPDLYAPVLAIISRLEILFDFVFIRYFRLGARLLKYAASKESTPSTAYIIQRFLNINADSNDLLIRILKRAVANLLFIFSRKPSLNGFCPFHDLLPKACPEDSKILINKHYIFLQLRHSTRLLSMCIPLPFTLFLCNIQFFHFATRLFQNAIFFTAVLLNNTCSMLIYPQYMLASIRTSSLADSLLSPPKKTVTCLFLEPILYLL